MENNPQIHSNIAGIINLTPDHLTRYNSVEDYYITKFAIFDKQTEDDFALINLDDKVFDELYKRSEINERVKAQKVYLSTQAKGTVFVYENNIRVMKDLNSRIDEIQNFEEKIDEVSEILMKTDELSLKGKHNLENMLFLISSAKILNVENEKLVEFLKSTTALEHRLENFFVKGNTTFINDSKGTNPDASVKAIEAFEKNIILIAGGMDKKVPFDKFVETFTGKHLGKVKKLILLGETKNIIKDCAQKHGFDSVELVNNMEEAVDVAHQQAESGDIVLLSPACASWDMYDSYEIRGEDFKNRVYALR